MVKKKAARKNATDRLVCVEIEEGGEIGVLCIAEKHLTANIMANVLVTAK